LTWSILFMPHYLLSPVLMRLPCGRTLKFARGKSCVKIEVLAMKGVDCPRQVLTSQNAGNQPKAHLDLRGVIAIVHQCWLRCQTRFHIVMVDEVSFCRAHSVQKRRAQAVMPTGCCTSFFICIPRLLKITFFHAQHAQITVYAA
jgi:hypothetical protein